MSDQSLSQILDMTKGEIMSAIQERNDMTTYAEENTIVPAVLEPVSVFEKEFAKYFTTYEATLVGVTPLTGGLPGDPNMIRGWLQRNAGVVKGDEQHKSLIVETIANLGYDVTSLRELALAEADISEIVNKATEIVQQDNKVNQFARTSLGELCLESRQVKAMIKEAAAIVFPTQFFSKENGRPMENKDVKKGKTLKSLVAEWIDPEPRFIGLSVTEPTEVKEQVGHTSNGAHLSAFELIENWTISFQIKVLHDLIDAEVWPHLWVYAETNGLGAGRSMGYGQFKITDWKQA